MRNALPSMMLLTILALPCRMIGQGVAPASASGPSRASELKRALTGTWVGMLEYRDYAEPAGSTKRVKLPTWLTVEMADGMLRLRYVYDDGPAKTVTETSVIRIDEAAGRATKRAR